jgi:septal ring factor EnvC (AmiA/AmiB activator)
LRHLVPFYQGEYTFTPFKVDDLWFVILTRGVPRIEERGSVGTLLAAARIHIPPMMDPVLAKRELDLRAREQEMAQRESDLAHRERRTTSLESEVRLALTRVAEMEADIRSREAKLDTLRDFAVQIQRSYVPPKAEKAKETAPPPPPTTASS